MSLAGIELARRIFGEVTAAHERFAAINLDGVVGAATAISQALWAGGKLLAFGNGGSAADAQHVVAELVGRFEGERRALAAVALTTDPSTLTAVANDYGFELVFARQVEALGREGDVALGISTSGRSPNVLAGLRAAKGTGLTTIALTGSDGGPIGAAADIHINVAETSAARVQEVHRTILHVLASLVERGLSESVRPAV